MKDKREKYDWNEIQKFYDNDKSLRDIQKKFGCAMATMVLATKKGKLKTRNQQEAIKISKITKPQPKHSEETKKRMSQIRLKYLKDNPDQVPYLLNHYSKGDSYPETYFKELFEKEKINVHHHLQIGLYQLDFYNKEKMIDIEIDGEQHYVDKRIFESDIRRTNYLTVLGWKFYRIRWSEYQKLCHTDKMLVIEEIKSMLTSPKMS